MLKHKTDLFLKIIFIFSVFLIFSLKVAAPWLDTKDITKLRIFGADEFQHSHSAWYLSKGQLPYRDYFEHHTPLLYFQIAPLLYSLKPENSPDAAKLSLIAIRNTMRSWVACSLVLVIGIGWLWIGGRLGLLVGITASALLASIESFWAKMIEIRPDVPALTFYLAAILLFLFALKSCSGSKQYNFKFNFIILFTAGLLLSIAALHTQKILFAGPGMALFWLWHICHSESRSDRKNKFYQLCSACCGFLVPIALIAIYYRYHGGLYELYYYNLIFNFNWQSEFSPYPTFKKLYKNNYFIVLSAGIGFLLLSLNCLIKASVAEKDIFLVFTATSIFAGLWIVPEPYLQCFQYLLPLIALFAAAFTVNITYYLIFQILNYSISLSLRANDKLVNQRTYLIGIVFTGLAHTILIIYHLPVPGNLLASKIRTNYQQFEKIAWLMNNTNSEDYILDGWPVYGVFRRHSWYYWTTHNPLPKMIPAEQTKSFTDSVIRGLTTPKLIKNGNFFKKLPERFKNHVKINYTLGAHDYWVLNR